MSLFAVVTKKKGENTWQMEKFSHTCQVLKARKVCLLREKQKISSHVDAIRILYLFDPTSRKCAGKKTRMYLHFLRQCLYEVPAVVGLTFHLKNYLFFHWIRLGNFKKTIKTFFVTQLWDFFMLLLFIEVQQLRSSRVKLLIRRGSTINKFC